MVYSIKLYVLLYFISRCRYIECLKLKMFCIYFDIRDFPNVWNNNRGGAQGTAFIPSHLGVITC